MPNVLSIDLTSVLAHRSTQTMIEGTLDGHEILVTQLNLSHDHDRWYSDTILNITVSIPQNTLTKVLLNSALFDNTGKARSSIARKCL